MISPVNLVTGVECQYLLQTEDKFGEKYYFCNLLDIFPWFAPQGEG